MTTHDVIIVGGGLSGLCVAHFLHKLKPELNVVLLEKSDHPGGAIQSLHDKGFMAEWGAHGFLDNVAASRELLDDTGLDHEAQKAPLGDFVRYICLNGRLVMIPQSPRKILASNIMPLTSKLRVLADLWKKPRLEEQSVNEWAAYRFGRGIVPFVDAALTGTYAGDADRLSIDAVMPGVRRMERDTGSVIRGALRKRRLAKQQKAAAGDQLAPGLPAMVSFPQGMARLTEVLATDAPLLLNVAVDSIRHGGDAWEVTAGDRTLRAGTLVLALSVNQALALLIAGGIGTRPPVDRIPEARIANVVLGFTDRAKIPFGFGYLAPDTEQRFALGALFSSHMFPGRTPPGHVLLEALVGGRRHPEKLSLSDDELINKTYADLAQLIRLPEKPCYARVLRPDHGIPQLEIGYPKLLQWRDALEQEQPALHVCGFGWEGIGINDMTRTARAVARAVVAGTGGAARTSVVKGVYF